MKSDLPASSPFETFDRLLPASKVYFSKQTPQQRVAIADQINYWRTLGATSFIQKTEGSAASKYADKIYELGEMSSRSFNTRSYFPLNANVSLQDCITYWRRLPNVTSIRVAKKHSTVKDQQMVEVAACINFSELCSPFHSSFHLLKASSNFAKITYSIENLCQFLSREYQEHRDFNDPTAERPLRFTQGSADTQFKWSEKPQQSFKRPAPSTDFQSEKQVRADNEELLSLLKSFETDNYFIFATKMRTLALKYGIKVEHDALSEADKLMK